MARPLPARSRVAIRRWPLDPAAIRVAMYVRASADPDATRKSTKRQINRGHRQLAALGLPPAVIIYEDDDRSAFDTSVIREHFLRMIQDMAADKFDVVWMWERERLQRRLGDFDLVTDAAAEVGIRFIVDDKWFDPANDDEWMVAGINAVMGTREVRKLRRRTREGREELAELGKPTGRPGYGYTSTYEVGRGGAQDKKTRLDVINEVEAKIVRWLADQVVAGVSIRSLYRQLNERGVPAPQASTWNAMSVKGVLLRPKLVGDRVFRGEVVGPGTWKPILTREIYDEVCTVLGGRRATAAPNSSKAKYLLSGLMDCSKCGGTIGAHHLARSTVVRYYCRDSACLGRAMEPTDIVVTDYVVTWLASDEAKALLEASRTQEGRDAAAQAKEISDRLDAAAEDCYVHQVIDRDQLARISATLRPQLEALQATGDQQLVSPLLGEAVGADAAHRWVNVYDLEKKRAIIRELFHVTMLPTGRGRRKFDRNSIAVVPRTHSKNDTP